MRIAGTKKANCGAEETFKSHANLWWKGIKASNRGGGRNILDNRHMPAKEVRIDEALKKNLGCLVRIEEGATS